MRTMPARSAWVEGRRSPLRGSTYSSPSLKFMKLTRPVSRTTSFSGSRPWATTRSGAERDRVFDDVRRDADHARLAIDDAAAVGEDVERLVVFDEDAGALEHLERRQMDLAEVAVAQRRQPEARPARLAGQQVPFRHARSSRSQGRRASAGAGAVRGAPAPCAERPRTPRATFISDSSLCTRRQRTQVRSPADLPASALAGLCSRTKRSRAGTPSRLAARSWSSTSRSHRVVG